MTTSHRDDATYDQEELRQLEWRLRDLEDPGRQVTPSASGQEYRRQLREDADRIRERLEESRGLDA